MFDVISLDDPVMWGAFKGLLSLDPALARWVLAAEDICFRNPIFSYIFRTGMSYFLFVASSQVKETIVSYFFSFLLCSSGLKCQNDFNFLSRFGG